jgi:hypothetical protein
MDCTSESLAGLLHDLRAARAGLLQAISGVSEQQFKRRPPASASDPDPWCIAEVLAHLLIDEKLWTQRIGLALTEDGSTVAPSDREQSLASIRNARLAPVPQLIHGLLASRRDLERLLEEPGLTRDALRQTIVGHRGRLSVAWMARKLIDHDREHVGQIEALRAGSQPAATTTEGKQS